MSTSMANEVVLIERCQRGDKFAIDELLSKYHAKAYMYALKMTKHSEEASDVVSEAFIRAYRAIGRFQLNSSFATWLYRILRNCFLDIRKRKSVKVVASLDAALDSEDGSVFWQPIDESDSPFETSAKAAHSRKVRESLEQLPELQRQMLLMYHAEQLTYDEIAEKLNTPVGTVKSRLNRARISLKQVIRDDEELMALVEN